MEASIESAGAYLKSELARGRASLFMGAGFSSGANDANGKPIPLGDELASELFAICFPGEQKDDSGLQDLFHFALRAHHDELEALLRERLTIDTATLPAWYELWFRQPWRSAWTLNVDVIEQAAAKRFALPHEVRSISALARHGPEVLDERALNVVHLNGIVDDGCEHVTFATSQYGRRLAERDRWYALLANELVERCFVFVGTRLDESPLWQHLEGRDVRRELQRNGDTPRSFLVTTKLDRARRCLLEDFSIDWVCASAEDFARKVLTDAPHR